jgi:hypothetical protein
VFCSYPLFSLFICSVGRIKLMQNYSRDNNEYPCNTSNCISVSSLYVSFSSVFKPMRGLYVTAALFQLFPYQILHISRVFLETFLLLFTCFFFLPLLSLLQFSCPSSIRTVFCVFVRLLLPSTHKVVFIFPFCFLYYMGFYLAKNTKFWHFFKTAFAKQFLISYVPIFKKLSFL